MTTHSVYANIVLLFNTLKQKAMTETAEPIPQEWVHEMKQMDPRSHEYKTQLQSLRELGGGAIDLTALEQEAQAEETPKIEIDLARIGWLEKDGKEEVVLDKVTEVDGQPVAEPYYLADIIDKSKVAKEALARIAPTMRTKLMKKIKKVILPRLSLGLKSGRGNRNDQYLDTEYTAYREGVDGANDRAIVLNLGRYKEDGLPVFALASIYDHNDNSVLRKFKKGRVFGHIN